MLETIMYVNYSHNKIGSGSTDMVVNFANANYF